MRKIDERFDKVDERFDKVDKQFVEVKSQIELLGQDIEDLAGMTAREFKAVRSEISVTKNTPQFSVVSRK